MSLRRTTLLIFSLDRTMVLLRHYPGLVIQLVCNSKNNKQVKHINISNLPESNTREIPNKQCTSVFLTLNSSRQLDATNHSQRTGLPLSGTLRSVTQQYPIPDLRQLLAVQLPLVRQHQAVGPSHPPHPATDEIMSLFSRAGTYHIAVNSIARILQ